MRKRHLTGLALLVPIVIGGCNQRSERTVEPEAETAPVEQPPPLAPLPVPGPRQASATLAPKSGSQAGGTATFTLDGGQVRLELLLQGLEPGTHAVHIHQVGDCSAADASSAGDHWNPTHQAHGQWAHDPYHLGDIGNVTAGVDGRAELTMSSDQWAIGGAGDHDIVGKSLVVHAKADDFATQPSGASGDRIACAVIEVQ